jgi:hypothetical protein
MTVARVTRGFDAIHENVATKADIDRLATRIDQVESGLKAEMRELELRLDADRRPARPICLFFSPLGRC